MLSLGHKFGNGLTRLNDASICNPNFNLREKHRQDSSSTEKLI